jgi:hypothetical protein
MTAPTPATPSALAAVEERLLRAVAAREQGLGAGEPPSAAGPGHAES